MVLWRRAVLQNNPTGRDPKDLAKLIEKNLEIPTIPTIASQALREMSDPNASGARLAKLIAKDPGLTARILRVSNSALYSPSKEVKNIQQATIMLGFNTLKSVVIAASVKMIYKRFGAAEQALWEHSIGCAIGSHVLANAKILPHRADAFVAGLMHDIGKVVMNNGAQAKFKEALTKSATGGVPSFEAEQAVFGFTHMDVGSMLVRHWQLPESLANAVFLHHEPELAGSLAEECADLVHTVHIANVYCHKLGFGYPATAELTLTTNDSAQELGFNEGQLQEVETKIVETFASERSALS